jgi:pimeloyl-ACP methyl ester carboxylesterase
MEADLPGVAAPTLVVGGARDPLAPPAWRRRLVELLPDARSVTVPGAAHNVATTAAPQVARAIVAFLQDRAVGPGPDRST